MRRGSGGGLPVENDDDGNDSAGGNGLAPVVDDDVAGGDLKRHQGGLEDEKVPAGGEAKGLVDVAAGKVDEGRRDGEIGHHLGHANGDGEDEGAPCSPWSGQVYGSTDMDGHLPDGKSKKTSFRDRHQ